MEIEYITLYKSRKGNRVLKICNNITTYADKDYIMFNDNWIGEYNRILCDGNNEIYVVLDFLEIEEEVPILPPIPASIPVNRLTRKKFSCVLLDKKVNVGDILYVIKT